MASEVWGIDIGKSSLKAVKTRRVKNNVEIVGIEIVEYVQASEEEVDREEQIRQALVELRNRTKLKKSERIFISIPGQATFNRMITIPPVEAKRVKEIVTYEAQQQIPFPIDEVLWDYQLLEDKEKALEEQEVMLFAVRKEIINNFLANLAAVDIAVEGIQIAPLALYNYIRHDRPELETCVVIDIGAENTDLVIVHGNKLWVRALPSAGDDITKALQKKFNIPYEEAEKLKLKAGKTKQAKKIFEVIKPVLKDIVGEIHRSVGYYKSMVKDIKFDKMLFMGNATKLTGFSQFFSQNLQYEIEVISEVNQIRISPQINVNLFQTNITSFSVAMGLGIQGLGLASNDIRLLPKEIYERTLREKQKPVLAIAVGMLVVIPAWHYYQSTDFAKKTTKLLGTIEPKQIEISNFNTALTLAKDLGDDGENAERLLEIGEGRYLWLEATNIINKAYLEAQDGMMQERGVQPWILDMEMDEVVKEPPRKPGMTLEEEKNLPKADRYIEIKFKIAMDLVGSRTDTSDFIEKHFAKLYTAINLRGKKLFHPIELDIEETNKLFPEQEKELEDENREKKFCHATFIMKCPLVEQKKLAKEGPAQ